MPKLASFYNFHFENQPARRGRVTAFRFGNVSNKFFMVILIALGILFYIAQNNQLSTKGYYINSLQTKLNQLQEYNDRLAIEAVRLQSVKELQQKTAKLDFVPIDSFEFLKSEDIASKTR